MPAGERLSPLNPGQSSRLSRRSGSSGLKRSPIVFAAVQRGGRVRAHVIPSSHGLFLGRSLRELVLPESMLFTDDWRGYERAGKTYLQHRRVNHSAKVYVAADGSHTQTVEGFFGLFETGVRGTHHDLAALASGLPERVGLALGPPERRRSAVQDAAAAGDR